MATKKNWKSAVWAVIAVLEFIIMVAKEAMEKVP